jgi:hypothetical protein
VAGGQAVAVGTVALQQGERGGKRCCSSAPRGESQR